MTIGFPVRMTSEGDVAGHSSGRAPPYAASAGITPIAGNCPLGGQIRLSLFVFASGAPKSETARPLVDFPFGLILGVPIFFLHEPDEFLPAALDLVPLVVGDIAPLGLSLALELVPAAFDLIPVHGILHLIDRHW